MLEKYMKILLLCWRDTTHPQGGGSERYLERVGEYLALSGHEVIFRAAKHTGAPRTSVRAGITYHRSGGKFSVYPRAWLAMLAGRFGVGGLAGVDVVIDTQNGIPFFSKIFMDSPTVLLTHHCHREQWPVAGPALAKLGWFLENTIAPLVYRTNSYVTVSEPSAAELVDLGVGEERITIIRNGIDPIPPNPPQLAHRGKRIITLSRLVPHKQIEHAIDTVAAIADVELDIVGSGWWQDELVAYAQRKGVTDRVIFHGQVAEEHKHALLERATVHLMPSRKEGWGLAVVEAAQHFLPTIGYTCSGGLNDSVVDGETGLLVSSKQAFISSVRLLLDDAAYRNNLGKQAERRARRFSWEKTGKQVEQLLLHIVQSDRPGI